MSYSFGKNNIHSYSRYLTRLSLRKEREVRSEVLVLIVDNAKNFDCET